MGHNILEYKSPEDGLNIDDLYKVLGYACIYKAETGGLDEISDTDITISLIRENKPRKLLGQLSVKYKIEEKTKRHLSCGWNAVSSADYSNKKS